MTHHEGRRLIWQCQNKNLTNKLFKSFVRALEMKRIGQVVRNPGGLLNSDLQSEKMATKGQNCHPFTGAIA